MESDTPRTDAENFIRDMGFEKWVSIEFARELERELAAAIKQRDEAVRALKEIAHQDYRGHPSTESHIAMNALAAMRKGEQDEE